MDEETLNQAIQLSKQGRAVDARKLLRPLLEVEPENEKAWLWYANSFDTVEDKMKALRNCLHYCPNSKMAFEGVRQLQSQLDEMELTQQEENADVAGSLQNQQESADVASSLRSQQSVMFIEPVEEQIMKLVTPKENVEEIGASPFISSSNRLDQIVLNGTPNPSGIAGELPDGFIPEPTRLKTPFEVEADRYPTVKDDFIQPGEGNRVQLAPENAFRTPFIIGVSLGIILLILLLAILFIQFLR
jgi:hypothetical protein